MAMAENSPQSGQNSAADNQPLFDIQRLYIKDLSFEAPNAVESFREKWQPEKLDIQLGTQHQALGEDIHEVVLTVTVTVNNNNKNAFVAEVKQAGIFLLKNFDPSQLHGMLGSVCPSLLFPYAREAISNMVTRGSFPQLILPPVNFEALYRQELEKQSQAKQAETQN